MKSHVSMLFKCLGLISVYSLVASSELNKIGSQ